MRRLSDKALEDTAGETSVGLRYRFYLLAFSTAILAIALLLFTQKDLNPYIRTMYPFLLIYTIILFVLTLVKIISLKLIEKLTTSVVMLSVVSEFIYTLFFLPNGFNIQQELSIGWFWQALIVIQMIPFQN